MNLENYRFSVDSLQQEERAEYTFAGCTTLVSKLCGCLLAFAMFPALAVEQNQAERIVSINQCADEFLLNIVPKDKLLSVTHFVKDPNLSWDADLAFDIPGNAARAEEVMSYDPDLVFAGDFTSRSTVGLLRSLGVEVVELAHPNSIAEVIELINLVGEATGYQHEAQKLIDTLVIQNESKESVITAAVYQPNGYTTGKHTLIDDVLSTAGVVNMAALRGLASYAQYPMERLIVDQPDLLILDPQVHAKPSLGHEFLKHPALESTFGSARIVEVPPQAWACGTHHVFAAVQLIRDAAADLE